MLPSAVRLLLLLLGGIAQLATALALLGRQQLHNNVILTLDKRQGTVLNTRFSTIFLTGDSTKPRTANAGYDCRVDLLHDLWGFCPSSVNAATDCGLAGSCVDSFSCSKGCGFTDTPYTTFTCSNSNEAYCSTALLTLSNNVGPFTYLACGRGTNTNEYFAFTTTAKPSSSSTPTSSTTSPSSPRVTTTDSTAQPTRPETSQANSPSTTPSPESSISSNTNAQLPSPNDSSTNNTGAIVGGIFGCLALLCGCAVVIFWIRYRDKNAAIAVASAAYDASAKPEVSGDTSPPEYKTKTGGLPVYTQPPAELSARSPVAYDAASGKWVNAGRGYPPMVPVELPGEGVGFGRRR